MSSRSHSTVPRGPQSLCFDTTYFTKEQFSVDQFLQDHRSGGNLETMRDDLGIYLKELRSAMIDLLNQDYADYVNLSSNLIGLDNAISNIITPIGQLREELLQVNQFLELAMNEVEGKLDEKKELREKKRRLRSLNRMHTSLKKLKMLLCCDEVSTKVLERAVSEYSLLQFHLTYCQHLMTDLDKQNYGEVGDLLLQSMCQMFVKCVGEGENGKIGLSSCLSLYLKIDQQQLAERLYRERVVSPILHTIIHDDVLKTSPAGLPALYNKILSFIDNDMKVVISLTSHNEKNPGLMKYDFLLNSSWPEIKERLEIDLSSIFAPGDPDVFLKRYNETINFLDAFGKRLKNPQTEQKWRSGSCFSSFLDKWNLPVYFQIRFQEIVKSIERCFLKPFEKSQCGDWKLKVSSSVWAGMNRCWCDDVFIVSIGHKFWKLTLQILSRYNLWISRLLQQQSDGHTKNETNSSVVVCLHSDLEKMIFLLPSFCETVISKFPSLSEKLKSQLRESALEWSKSAKNLLGTAATALISRLRSEAGSSLHQVADLPRFYRKTNREAPAKPSAYVSSAVNTLNDFATSHAGNLHLIGWMRQVLSALTAQYYTSVSDVLTSVQKTEESLRRLKKSRDKNIVGTQGQSQTERRPADDDKIRLQLLIDVTEYCQQIEKIGIRKNSVDNLNDLLLLVENTQKI